MSLFQPARILLSLRFELDSVHYLSKLSLSTIYNKDRRTDERDPSLFQVLSALKEVVEDAVEAEEHAVDRQVPPVGVDPPVLGELDVCLPAVTDDVDAQRGHLEVLAVVDASRHRAVLLAERVDGAHPLRLEHGLHLVGRRRGGKVLQSVQQSHFGYWFPFRQFDANWGAITIMQKDYTMDAHIFAL